MDTCWELSWRRRWRLNCQGGNNSQPWNRKISVGFMKVCFRFKEMACFMRSTYYAPMSFWMEIMWPQEMQPSCTLNRLRRDPRLLWVRRWRTMDAGRRAAYANSQTKSQARSNASSVSTPRRHLASHPWNTHVKPYCGNTHASYLPEFGWLTSLLSTICLVKYVSFSRDGFRSRASTDFFIDSRSGEEVW